MKYLLFIIFALLLQPLSSRAQDAGNVPPSMSRRVIVPDSAVVEQPDEMPEFPGGSVKLYSFLGNNLEYPTSAADIDLQGKVIVEFVVCEDGSICNEKIIKSFNKDCADEVLRVIKKMPAWTPGKKYGKKVKAKYRLPVEFRLN